MDKYGDSPTVLCDVTDFIYHINKLNIDIQAFKKAIPSFDPKYLVLIASDMKTIYPSTKTEVIQTNLEDARTMVKMSDNERWNERIYNFVMDAVTYEIKHSHFKVDVRTVCRQVQ